MKIRTVWGWMAVGGLCSTLLVGCGDRARRDNRELLQEAMAATDRGEWKKAQSLSYQATQQDPQDVNALVMLAGTLEQNGQYDQALTQLRRAIEIDPDHFAAQYNAGRILFDHQQFQDCPAPLEKALALRPNHADARMLLARTYAALGNPQAAIRHYVVLARDPQYASGSEIFNEIGVLLINAGDDAKGATFLAKAYRSTPNCPEVIGNLAILCDEHLGQRVKAVALYRRYLQVTEGNLAYATRRDKVAARIKHLGG